MSGHLGRRVSALLDGQLSAAEADVAWGHVHLCASCRAEVEHEGWVKTRLSTLGDHHDQDRAPDHLKGALRELTPLPPVVAPLQVGQLGPTGYGRLPTYPHLMHPAQPVHQRSRGRRIGLAAMGGGAVGAAVVGLLALGAAPADAPIDRRLPPSSVSPVNLPAPVPVRLRH